MTKPFSPADIPGLVSWTQYVHDEHGETVCIVHVGEPPTFGANVRPVGTVIYDRVLTVEERLAIQRHLESLP